MKRWGLLAIGVLGLLTLMAQAAPKNQIVEGSGFVLRDGNGKARAILGMDARGPFLRMYHPNGNEQVLLDLNVDLHNGGGSLAFSGPDGKRRMVLAHMKDVGPFLFFVDDTDEERLALSVRGNEPHLRFSDAEGFETRIGSTDLVTPRTGETHKTSAASIVLFGKSKCCGLPREVA